MDDLVFLLQSPLFLYAVGPRLRSANRSFRDPTQDATKHPDSLMIEVYQLSVLVRYDGGCCVAQLRYGANVLIDARDLGSAHEANDSRDKALKRCLKGFCAEIAFLGCEYRAREGAAAAILGCDLLNTVESKTTELQVVKSKIVKLPVSKQALIALKKKEIGRVTKTSTMKLKLRLQKDVVDG